jgi:hypothetical protein
LLTLGAQASMPLLAASSIVLAARQWRQAAATSASKRFESGMRIEQRALRFAAQQRLMSMLSVNVDQRFGHLTQLLHGDRRTIQIGARTAVGIEHPTQQQ